MTTIKTGFLLKNIELSNRLVLPPMATSKTANGYVNDDILTYYEDKTKDGLIGLVITEHSYVNLQGMANAGQMSISRDTDIYGVRKLVQTIKSTGSRVIIQISRKYQSDESAPVPSRVQEIDTTLTTN